MAVIADNSVPASGCARLRMIRFAAMAAAVLIAPQTFAAEAVVLKPAQPLEAALQADEHREYRLVLPRNAAVELTLTQTENTLQLEGAEGSGLASAARPASGRMSALRRVLIAGDAPGEIRFSVRPVDAGLGTRYRLLLGPVRPASPALHRRAAAEAQFDAAEALRRAGDKASLAQARPAYLAAIRRFEGEQDGCNARAAGLQYARLEYAATVFPAALAAAKAATRTRCAADRADLAKAHHLAAVSNSTLGDFPAAIAAESRALRITRAIGDPANEAVLLGNLATMQRVVGANGKALAAANQALAIARQRNDRERIAFVDDSLAGLYLVRGELSRALAAHRQTLADLQGLRFPLIEANARLNLGITLYRLGDHDEALETWNQAEAICRANDDVACLAHLDDSRGDLFRDDARCDDAEVAYRRALAQATEKSLQREAADARRGLGLCAAEHGRFDEARSLIGQSLEGFQGIAAVEAVYAQLSLGDLESRRRQTDEARRAYGEALRLALTQQAAGAEVAARASLAKIDFDAGRLEAAREGIGKALASIEVERARIDDPALRTGYFDTARSYYALLIDILLQLEQRTPGQGHAEAALMAAERARARALTDQLAQRALLSDQAVPPALRAERDAADDHLHELGYALARTETAPAGTEESAERAGLRRRIAQATRALDTVRGRIRAAAPRYAEIVDPPPLSLSQVRRDLLDEDTEIDAYWLGESRSVRWVLTRDGVRCTLLPPRAEIEADVEALRTHLAHPARLTPGMSLPELAQADAAEQSVVRTMAAGLRKRLALPADGETRRHRIIVADGVLQRLPFAILDEDSAAPHEDSYLPSIQTLRWLRAASGTSHGRRATQLAIFADPVFAPDDPRLAQAAIHEPVALHQSVGRAAQAAGLLAAPAGDLAGGLPRLQHSDAEARAVAALVPAPARVALQTGFAASRETALGMDWSRVRIAHFATHALLDTQSPALSGIVLSLYDAHGQPQDGFLSVNDIYRLDLPAELVVLSACESADAANPRSEDRFNLARAFFYGGAQRVLASLWTVDDRASAEFMQRFYRALLIERQSPDAALRSAQMRLAQDARWAAPYYWAGYVLQGDGRATRP